MNKLTLSVDYELDYFLIAIKTRIEDYRFAYFLNKTSFFQFERSMHDISFLQNKQTILFPYFEYLDDDMERSSFLIKNTVLHDIKDENSATSLFFGEPLSNTFYLIPELKEFDYLIKLVGIWKNSEKVYLKKYLQHISFVESEAIIDHKNLKSINNLVF